MHKGFLQIFGQLDEVAGLHDVGGPSLGFAAQVGCVSEHRRERHFALDGGGAVSDVGAGDLPSSGVDVAHDVAHVFFGAGHDDLHDRLEQRRRRFRAGLLEGHAAADLEAHLGRVDLMEGTVQYGGFDVHHLEAGEDAREHGSLDALVDAGDELLGDRAAGDFVDELVALAGLVGFDHQFDVRVLALAAGLADVTGVDRGAAPQGGARPCRR